MRARARRSPTGSRRARGATGAPDRARGARALGAGALAAGGARPARRGARARRRPRGAASASPPRPRRCSPRRGGGPRRCSTPRARSTRAWPRPCAARCASWPRCPADLQPRAGRAGRHARGAAGVPRRAGRAPGRVTVSEPQALRARRVRALFCLGLQEGDLPGARRGPSRSWATTSAARSTRPRACGCACTRTRCSVERLFFYAAVSRPTELLALGWHAADDDGAPTRARRCFVDDVRRPARRGLGATRRAGASWAPRAGRTPSAPTEREAARFAAAAAPPAQPPVIAPLRAPAALGPLRERHTWSASQLEVVGVVPGALVRRAPPAPGGARRPTPSRWSAASSPTACSSTRCRALAADGGALVPERLPDARAARARARWTSTPTDFKLSPNPERLRSRAAPARGRPAALPRVRRARRQRASRPSHVRGALRQAEDPHPPLELDDGALRIAGRIDRIDLGAGRPRGARLRLQGQDRDAAGQVAGRGQAAGRAVPADAAPRARPRAGRRALPAARRGARPAAPARRGAATTPTPAWTRVRPDRVDAEELEALLEACAQAARDAVAAAARRRAGAARPSSCAYGGGCAHPTICRCVTRMTVAAAALYDDAGRLIGRHGLPFTDEQADAIAPPRGPAAAVGQRRLGQDLRVGRALRALGARGRARARADPRDHVHREGRGRAAHARAGALRRARAPRPRARPRVGAGSRRSTGSARGSCAPTRCAPGSTRRSASSTRPRRATCAAAAFEAALAGFLAGDARPRRSTSPPPTASTRCRAIVCARTTSCAARARRGRRCRASARRRRRPGGAGRGAGARARPSSTRPTSGASVASARARAGALRGAAGRRRGRPGDAAGARRAGRRRVQAGQPEGA